MSGKRPPPYLARGMDRTAKLACVLAAVLALAAMPAALAGSDEEPFRPRLKTGERGPDLQVLAPASPLPAKARVNLFLEVINLGPGAANDISVLVQPARGSDVVVIGQAERGLDRIRENGSDLLVVRLATPNEPGGGAISLLFTFLDDDGKLRHSEQLVTFFISPPESAPLEIAYDGRTLAAGRTNDITLFVRNAGHRPVTELDLEVETQTQFGSITRRGQDIAPGRPGSLVLQGAHLAAGGLASVDVPIRVSRDAEDLLLFRVVARYTFEGYERVQEFEFGARIGGTVDLRVLEAREVDTGIGLELVGTIVNTGTGIAYNPRIDAANGSGYLAAAPRLIEDLEPNEAVDFRLPVVRTGDRELAAPLLFIDHNDADGELFATTVRAIVEPLPAEEPTILSTLWERINLEWILIALAVLVALALLAVLARNHRERKALEEAEQEEYETSRRGDRRKAKPGG